MCTSLKAILEVEKTFWCSGLKNLDFINYQKVNTKVAIFPITHVMPMSDLSSGSPKYRGDPKHLEIPLSKNLTR
jgi:hypothetical protein